MNNFNKIKEFILLELAFPVLDFIMNTSVHFYYHEIKKMNIWSEEKIGDWQNEQLQKLIKHHYTNTKYYKRIFDEIGLKPEDIKTKEDLVKIPPVNKDIIRKYYEEFIPNNLSEIKYKAANTGGSSGKTLQYYLDLRAWSYTVAAKIYAWKCTGYLYGERYASIGSTSLFPDKPSLIYRLYYKFKSALPLNGMNLSDEKIVQHLNILEKEKIKYLYGYASALYLIARYMNKHNIRLKHVKCCFSTSEVLTAEYRAEIEKAFPKIMDGYGARDSSINAYEIQRDCYNVGYNSIAEIVDCFDKETGTLLVTDVLNFAFPFIRYNIDDDVTLPQITTSFNYNGQVMTKILGRSPDIIRLSNGNVLTGPAFQLLFGKFNVSAYRIMKKAENEINIEIQPGLGFEEKEAETIVELIKKQAGETSNITIKKVQQFEPNKNGKRNFFMANNNT